MAETTNRTPLGVAEGILKARAWLAGATLVPEYVIDDYPIGRRDRGKCRLGVEHSKGRGWRTVRTTTDKHGRWCSPKKSVYHEGIIVVYTRPGDQHVEAGWLNVSMSGIWLCLANFNQLSLVKAPSYCRPNREPHTYTLVTQVSDLNADMKLVPTGGPTRKQHTIEADPPELCDAYDLWEVECKKFAADVIERIKAAAA